MLTPGRLKTYVKVAKKVAGKVDDAAAKVARGARAAKKAQSISKVERAREVAARKPYRDVPAKPMSVKDKRLAKEAEHKQLGKGQQEVSSTRGVDGSIKVGDTVLTPTGDHARVVSIVSMGPLGDQVVTDSGKMLPAKTLKNFSTHKAAMSSPGGRYGQS